MVSVRMISSSVTVEMGDGVAAAAEEVGEAGADDQHRGRADGDGADTEQEHAADPVEGRRAVVGGEHVVRASGERREHHHPADRGQDALEEQVAHRRRSAAGGSTRRTPRPVTP